MAAQAAAFSELVPYVHLSEVCCLMSPSATGFFADTLVWTRDGRKPIEQVCVGDGVLSFPEDQVPPPRDREKDEFTYVQVNRVFSTENVPVSEVNIVNFASNHIEPLKVASDQRFFAKRHGWTPARELTYRHVLFAENFCNLAVGEVVGAAGWLVCTVWNSSPLTPATSGSLACGSTA